MIAKGFTLLSLLGLVAGFPMWHEEGSNQDTAQIRHTPASLNKDGTVAFTKDVREAAATHRAAFLQQLQKLQKGASTPTANPHHISDHYEVNNNGAHGSGQLDDGQYKPSVYHFKPSSSKNYDDGQYKPHHHQEGEYNLKQFDDGQYRPHQHYGKQKSSEPYSQSAHYKNSAAQVPAELNADGTVAHTPEYRAIASSFLAAYKQALTRHRRSAEDYQGKQTSRQFDDGQYKRHHHQEGEYNLKQFDDGQYKPHQHYGKQKSSEPYSQKDHNKNSAAQVPAELNADGTVAHTPEYKAIASSFLAAYKQALTRDRRSAEHYQGQYSSRNFDDGQYKPHHHYPGQNTKQFDDGQYKTYHHYGGQQNIKQFDDGQYRPHHHGRGHYHRNPAAQVPAELNADGTVAHTPEYKAIASSFLAAYKQALTRHRRSAERYQGPPAPLNSDGTVDFTPETQQAKDAHKAAIINHIKRLQEAASLAAAHPDLTSPPSHYKPHNNGQYKPHLHDPRLNPATHFL